MTPKVLDPAGKGDWDWRSYEKGEVPHVQPFYMKHNKWAMVYSSEAYKDTTELFNMMQRAAGRLGMKVEEPVWCEL